MVAVDPSGMQVVLLGLPHNYGLQNPGPVGVIQDSPGQYVTIPPCGDDTRLPDSWKYPYPTLDFNFGIEDWKIIGERELKLHLCVAGCMGITDLWKLIAGEIAKDPSKSMKAIFKRLQKCGRDIKYWSLRMARNPWEALKGMRVGLLQTAICYWLCIGLGNY